jgi:hypothetical protein
MKKKPNLSQPYRLRYSAEFPSHHRHWSTSLPIWTANLCRYHALPLQTARRSNHTQAKRNSSSRTNGCRTLSMSTHPTLLVCTPPQTLSATMPRPVSPGQVHSQPHLRGYNTAKLRPSMKSHQGRIGRSACSVQIQRRTEHRGLCLSGRRRSRQHSSYQAAFRVLRGRRWRDGVAQCWRGRRTCMVAVRYWVVWRISVFHCLHLSRTTRGVALEAYKS